MGEASGSHEIGQSTDCKVISNWSDFSKWIHSHNSLNWIFRGVTDPDYRLVPKVGRPESHHKSAGYERDREIWMLNEFKRRVSLNLPGQIPRNEWEWLALAQHHGLPTRLLDWSHSPLFAAFFATEHPDSDLPGVLYAIELIKHITAEQVPDGVTPLDVNKVMRFDPPYISPRINAQQGTFTIHPDPTEPFDTKKLERIEIDNKWLRNLRSRLNNLGVNRATLFPDPDGLATYITWRNTISRKVELPQTAAFELKANAND